MVVSSQDVVWHDLECGSYHADLPLWRELAERAAIEGPSARILDIGAGSGRVALPLAREGHRVTALDLDGGLLDALRERAGDSHIETVCADARSFELERDDFDLGLMPMQTIQLLGGPGERVAFLKLARAHLRSGGLLAVAIVTAVEAFDCADGDIGPTPESAHVDGALYLSRPTRVRVLAGSVLIERERVIYHDREASPGERPRDRNPATGAGAERDAIELQRLDADQLELEAGEAGLRPEPARTVGPTDDHVGSTVVMLRA